MSVRLSASDWTTSFRLYFSAKGIACRLGGSKVYVDRSKECLLDMMKASRLRGKPGQGGLALAATLLITELQEGAWLLMGKSAAERQEAEESLQEALQVCTHAAYRLSRL